MKIYLTGCTSTQTNSKTRMGIFSLTRALHDGLMEAGHKVVWGEPVPDGAPVPVEDYDMVLMGMAPVNSLGARWASSAMGLVGLAIQAKVPVMTFIDDWKVREVQQGLRRFTHHPEALERYVGNVQATKALPWVLANQELILATIAQLHDEVWPTTLACTFPWGDHSRLRQKTTIYELVTVDPSWMVPEYPIVHPPLDEKYRQWILAGISRFEPWAESLPGNWPVAMYGGVPKLHYPRIPEEQVPQLYAENWGVLCHSYPHAGSGWWRNRFTYAIHARSILYGDHEEVKDLGWPYTLPMNVIETLPVFKLRDLADAQAEAFKAKTWPREKYVDTLHRIVTAFVAGEPVGIIPNEVPKMPPPRRGVLAS